MADRPILFSGSMIRALLDGRKTQTRRVLKPLPNRTIFFDAKKAGVNQHQSPRFAIGDRLWVRERGWISKSKLAFQPYVGNEDAGTPTSPDGTPYKVCVSIHMPRFASRLTLTVTDVRVERLQDCGDKDAVAEGIEKQPYAGDDPQYQGMFAWKDYSDHPHAVVGFHHDKPVLSYRSLWDSINGPGAWDANPWVVAYTFTVERGNIDQIGRAAA